MPGPFHASARYYDEVYGHVDYRAHALAVDAAVRANRLDARSLLDVACGTGRHLEVLRSRYDEVAGVDIDPSLVEIARSRNPGVEIHLGDMTEFVAVALHLGRTVVALQAFRQQMDQAEGGGTDRAEHHEPEDRADQAA